MWGEIELFAQALASLKEERGYAPKVIAITGTNGKTTVTSLTGLLCRARRPDRRAWPATSARPRWTCCAKCWTTTTLPQAWILELSSFQLHATFSLDADAATVLNLTQDHLDWHGDMAAYAADKARIFGDRHRARAEPRRRRRHAHGRADRRRGHLRHQRAGRKPERFGLLNERGVLWLADRRAGRRKRKEAPQERAGAEAVPCIVNRLMPADALHIRGIHNASNALAALALCRAIGLPFAPLLHGLREYKGEPHRVELVATIDGVDYYDDSKGTNVGATVAALNGLGKAFGGEDAENRADRRRRRQGPGLRAAGRAGARATCAPWC